MKNNEEEYIYLPEWWDENGTIPLSQMLCHNSPYPTTLGTSLWTNLSRREWNKLMENKE